MINPDVFASTSQLVMRNREMIKVEHLLIIAPPADYLVPSLLSQNLAANVVGLTQDFSVYKDLLSVWQGTQQTLIYGATISASDKRRFDGVLMFLQKSKPLMNFWLDMLAPLMAPKGKLWLVGENNKGIKSWRKRLQQPFNEVVSVDNARHCGLVEASGLKKEICSFDINDYYQSFDVEIGKSIVHVLSLPGVFSYGRLDKGTSILLDHLEDVQGSKVIDFACGSGIIGAIIAKKLPKSEITLIDCDALAIESTRKTLNFNTIKNCQVLASNGFSEVKGNYDLILSNPPFHKGVKTDYEVVSRFLKESYEYLQSGGELRIVANSFLKYEPMIIQAFGYCDRLNAVDGFSIYSAIK